MLAGRIKSLCIVQLFLPHPKPPFGDTDDRIRFIAHSLDLVTILWQYDTFDWKGGRGDAQADAEVDKNYADIVSLAENGAFDSVSQPGCELAIGMGVDCYGFGITGGGDRAYARAKYVHDVESNRALPRLQAGI